MAASTVQDLFYWDSKTGKTSKAWNVRRADTVKRLTKLAGEAEAAEFAAMIKKAPDRREPWMSKSGHVVIFFTERQDEWA
ncbi:hypothetical protein RBS60_10875 [Sinomonas sp. ASV486]|uniref:hypothetical protein n=1 Tax=Sinomonas sp. ASV486 TaxID=3051170 RepID=UPI0027DE78E4|nr:hypothetical protein [Sinomonas sp. ASV486]MDQ4490701.1 hypothetical protein [Sinomonas sp. ASV486]